MMLMLSGIGPAERLREVGLPVRADLPVGKNLLDHPEGGVVYRTTRPIHQPEKSYRDAVLLANAPGSTSALPDPMMWFFSGHVEELTARNGREPRPTPEGLTTFSPESDATRPRSVGEVTLRSAEPADSPRTDPRYSTDPEGFDERMMPGGLELARRVAEESALASWVDDGIAPGREAQDDEELPRYARTTSYTAYHPAGTCRTGAPDDARTFVDPQLRVHGTRRLRVADASVFPTLPAVNPTSPA